MFALLRHFYKPASRFFASGCLWLFLASLSHAQNYYYPWVYLSPENDSRDPEMCDQDEAFSRQLVQVVNGNEPLLHDHVIWKQTTINNLLGMQAPFCEMHFDAVNPVGFSPGEKTILAEYFKRGGFMLLFIDTYPYPQDEFWKIKEWPVIDFLTRELPASDPDFTTGRATDDFAIFKVHYQTQTADAIRHELEGNPNTPNRTLLFYRHRLCAFVMGSYGPLEDDTWIPIARPFPREFSTVLKSYELMVNVYIYSIVR